MSLVPVGCGEMGMGADGAMVIGATTHVLCCSNEGSQLNSVPPLFSLLYPSPIPLPPLLPHLPILPRLQSRKNPRREQQ